MKTIKLIICLPILFIGLFSKAQISLHQSDMPANGSKFAYVTTYNDTMFNVGPSGANQTWNFSINPLFSHIDSTYIKSPTNTLYASVFPTANYCIETETGVQHFFLMNNDSSLEVGLGSYDGNDTFSFNNKVFDFPTTYLSQNYYNWYDTFIVKTIFTSQDSLMAVFIHDYNTIVDGWGGELLHLVILLIVLEERLIISQQLYIIQNRVQDGIWIHLIQAIYFKHMNGGEIVVNLSLQLQQLIQLIHNQKALPTNSPAPHSPSIIP